MTPKRMKDGKRAVTKAKAPPMVQFEDLVPRKVLMQALETSEDPRFQALFVALSTPRGSNSSLMALTKKPEIGLRWDELVTFYKDHQAQKTMIVAMQEMPTVMHDVAQDSKSRMESCPRCDGEGTVSDPVATDDAVRLTKNCPRCEGIGKIRVSGDAAARALLFEATGMKGQKGPLVAQQFNFNGGLEPLAKTVSVVQQITGGKG